MNEPPHFRDELMFVKDTASDATAADAVFAEAGADAAPDAGPSPSPDLPPEPPFTESPAQLPEDPPGVSAYPGRGPRVCGSGVCGSGVCGRVAVPGGSSAFHESPPMPVRAGAAPSSPFLDAAAKIAAEATAMGRRA
jgi:hypothetical protein